MTTIKRIATLAGLAAVTVAGLVPAAALSLAGTAAAAAQAPLWVTHQDVLNGGINAQVAASPDGSAVYVTGATPAVALRAGSLDALRALIDSGTNAASAPSENGRNSITNHNL